jgi:hypothetical protein
VDLADLISVVLHRVTVLDEDLADKSQRLAEFVALSSKYGITPESQAAFANADFVREVADMLAFPHELFALRVKEVLLKCELEKVESALRDFAPRTIS